MIEDTNTTSATADSRDGITVPWVFSACHTCQFTHDQILNVVDGLSKSKLDSVFMDAHIDGGAFAAWASSRRPPQSAIAATQAGNRRGRVPPAAAPIVGGKPVTLRPEFATFLRSRLESTGKTVFTLENPGVFVINAMRNFRASELRAEEERQRQARKDWLRYVTLLRRADNPQEGDTEDLVRVTDALGRTFERVKQDLVVVCAAKNLVEQRDRFRQLSGANDRLQVLSRQHPEFFECESMAPALLSEPTPARKPAPKPAAAPIGDTGTAAAVASERDNCPVDDQPAGNYQRQGGPPRPSRAAGAVAPPTVDGEPAPASEPDGD